jgi:hypothetical protein
MHACCGSTPHAVLLFGMWHQPRTRCAAPYIFVVYRRLCGPMVVQQRAVRLLVSCVWCVWCVWTQQDCRSGPTEAVLPEGLFGFCRRVP